MDGKITGRFDFLEERLQQLDELALSQSEEQRTAIRIQPEGAEAEDSPDRNDRSEGQKVKGNGEHDPAEPALTSTEDLNATAVTQGPITCSPYERDAGGENTFSSRTDIASSDESLSTSNVGISPLQEASIQDCRKRLALLVDAVMEDAGRRLRQMVDQTCVSFLADAEASLEKSATIIANKALQGLQHEIQTAMEQFSPALQTGVRPVANGRDVRQAGSVKPGTGFVSRENGRRGTEFESEPLAAIEAIRIRSNIPSSGLGTRLQAALQAFEGEALKQVAASLQETLGNLAKRGIEASQEPPKRLGQPEVAHRDTRNMPEAPIHRSPVPTSSGSGAQGSAPDPSDRGRSRHTTEYLASVIARAYVDSKERERTGEASRPSDGDSAPHPKKSQRKQPSWRILGLS